MFSFLLSVKQRILFPLEATMTSIQGHMDAIKLVSWTLAITVVVVLIVRQIAKTIVFRKVGLDDSFILIASVSEPRN